MYTILWVILGIFALLILYGHIGAYIFNEKHKNYNLGSLIKDIRPYRILRFLWGLIVLATLLLKYIIEDRPNKNISISDNTKKEDSINKDNNSKGDNKNDKNIGVNTGNINTTHGIVNEEQAQNIKDKNNVIINPIADGYYEIITSDPNVTSFIETSEYIIPKPINTSSCDPNMAFWNLRGDFGINYNNFLYEYINSHKKKDVIIALLDSGIDWDNKTIKGHLAKNKNEFNSNTDSDNNGYIDDIYGVNIAAKDGNIQDTNGHGTHIAGIILQTFPNATILPIKLNEGNNESIDEYNIIKGLRYAIDSNVDIINMSFGGEGFNEVTNTLINEATEKGIIVIAAAGNEGKDVNTYYPASYSGVINVGSLGDTGKSTFSNYNTDSWAPGECIYSYGLQKEKEFWGGTSMSAPHLAGILGTYISLGNTLGNKSDILNTLNKSAKTRSKIKIIDMANLIGLEQDNNSLYENIKSIETNLNTTKSKLINLKDSKLIESELSTIASYSTSLSKSANNIGEIYSKLSINSGFGIDLKKSIEDYNELLGKLNIGGLYLETTGGILSNSLGIAKCDPYPHCDYFDIIIGKGSNLPNNNFKTGYTTVKDNQDKVDFRIYQGENTIASKNKYLGKVTLNIPAKPEGEVTMSVYFDIDKDGKLTVKAEDEKNPTNTITTTATASRDTITITGDNYYEIQNTIDELIKLSEKALTSIQNFYNLDPFKYIPLSVNGSYSVIKPEIKTLDTTTKNIQTKNPKGEIVLTGTKSNIKENIKVEEVIDGDTIRVTLNGQSQKIRLIGVDAPESYDTRYGYTECFGAESSKYLKNLLSNKTIGLEYDSTQGRYDKYDRVLTYVFLNGENINKKIISDGYAREYTYNLPYKYQKEFKEAQSNASKSNKGLWNKNTCNGERKAGS